MASAVPHGAAPDFNLVLVLCARCEACITARRGASPYDSRRPPPCRPLNWTQSPPWVCHSYADERTHPACAGPRPCLCQVENFRSPPAILACSSLSTSCLRRSLYSSAPSPLRSPSVPSRWSSTSTRSSGESRSRDGGSVSEGELPWIFSQRIREQEPMDSGSASMALAVRSRSCSIWSCPTSLGNVMSLLWGMRRFCSEARPPISAGSCRS
mmetsp:Transcript_13183/g.44682  ORF Transcript_13183/g.44682 Transcript_13183/m.44682 type:complete len:212 (-) Transcript_13183:391-1026(-)